MKHNTGVRLQSNGNYWQAAWQVPGQRRPRVQSIGSKDKYSKRAALAECRKIQDQHAKQPGMITAGKAPTLEAWCTEHLTVKGQDFSAKTIEMHTTTIGYLKEFFGASRMLDAISKHDAKTFRPWLAKKPSKYAPRVADELGTLSAPTVCRHIAIAKAIFGEAAESDLIPQNPFANLSTEAGIEPNFTPIPDASIEAVLSVAPSKDWKCLIALCAYAGLRQGEALRLKWSDIDWNRRRITVKAKAGRTDSKNRTRHTLLESQLAAVLDENRNNGNERVAPISISNIERRMTSIIEGAGLSKWGKPFHTLRKTRATTWRSRYPEHVVDRWLGHSLAVARKHYVEVPEEFYGSKPTVHKVAADFSALSPEEQQAIIHAAAKSSQLPKAKTA